MIKEINRINGQYKVTIPRQIREDLGLEIDDFLHWEVIDRHIVIKPVKLITEE
jgi:bifunctional DNA-binding transcriptional regulator/antitoxin component of YhaV-PrlF toxin-antitoxin module